MYRTECAAAARICPSVPIRSRNLPPLLPKSEAAPHIFPAFHSTPTAENAPEKSLILPRRFEGTETPVIASTFYAGFLPAHFLLCGIRGFGVAGSRMLFGGAVFLAAFLLFLVEPIAAKQLLPSLGGSAAVWITCLVFFQTALLLAYLYAHWFAARSVPHVDSFPGAGPDAGRGSKPPSSLVWNLHLLLLAAALALAAFWAFGGIDLSSGPAHPILTIFFALSLWIGLPFLALGSSSPLLQVWWARLQLSQAGGA